MVFDAVIPAMKTEEVEEVLKKRYAFTQVNVEKYKSYSNQNFYVEANQNGQVGIPCVFRIRNCIGINNGVEMLRQSHMLQRQFHNLGVNVPLPIETIRGETCFVEEITYSDGKIRVSAIELVDFLPGKTIAETTFTKDEFYDFCSEVGKLSGKLHATMLNVPPENEQEMKDFVFYFQNTDQLEPTVQAVKHKKLRNICDTFLARFKSEIKPSLHEYRRCYIHNDLSNTNILTAKCDSSWYVSGLIDFEDAHYGYLVSDFAICVAYMMGKGTTINCDANKVARMVISGHEGECPLLSNEKDLLYDCILGRAIASYAAGQYLASKSDEENASHCAQANMFPGLIEMLVDMGRKKILNIWFDAIA